MQTFDEWIISHAEEIEAAQQFTKSDLPTMPAEIQTDLNTTVRTYPRVGELLADVESHLIQSRAQAILDVKKDTKYEDLSAKEREFISAAKVAYIVRTRDILATTVRALHERSFALLNQRRYEEASMRMTGHGEAS